MSTLTIEKKNALVAYKKADDKGKSLLSNLFGTEIFSQKITDRIKTWEDVCQEGGIHPDDDRFTEGEPDEVNYRKAKLLTKVLNEGWKPNWNNNNQHKWVLWFYMDKPGFRLGGADDSGSGTYTGAGSRLCFASRELAEHAAKYFLDIYKSLMAYEED